MLWPGLGAGDGMLHLVSSPWVATVSYPLSEVGLLSDAHWEAVRSWDPAAMLAWVQRGLQDQ